MRRHDHLADGRALHRAQQFQKLDLPRWRQCRFRLVENEEALALASLLEEPHEALAVRMRQEVGRGTAGGVEIARHGEKTFGAEEPAVGDFRQPAGAHRLRQLFARFLDRLRVIDRPIAFAAARPVVPRQRGDAFEQGRFSGAVLAGNDGDRSVEVQFKTVPQKRQAERIGLALGCAHRLEPNAPEIRRRQIDGAVLASHRGLRAPGLAGAGP